MTDFFLKNLRETLEAINKLIAKNINIVTCKRVRNCNNIKSSDRSKITFIWRSLRFLEQEGFLELIERNSSRQYRICILEQYDIDPYLRHVEKIRKSQRTITIKLTKE